MKNEYKDISDDEIQVLGKESRRRDHRPISKHLSSRKRTAWLVAIVAGVVCLLLMLYFIFMRPRSAEYLNSPEPGYFESVSIQSSQLTVKLPLARASEVGHGFIEMTDTIINDIPLRLYLPHHISMSLYVGAIDRNDPSILFATQAADVRADNGGIVGAFVLKGEPLAWGLSKKGFCAIINDTVTVGVADNSPLFEEATEKDGYFFRQFPLVDNGKLVENELKGKSFRRAVCDRSREIFIAETLTIESLHDFAQALVDLGVDQAIYLVGANAYGWATDAEGHRHEFGNPEPPKKKWDNISYLVMQNRE